jgi:DNA-directed RNA polymerase specialized sigma24 family protein
VESVEPTPSLKQLEPVIVRVCTPRERDALAFREAGYSWRKMAVVLDVSPVTARDRVLSAMRKVQRELERTL